MVGVQRDGHRARTQVGKPGVQLSDEVDRQGCDGGGRLRERKRDERLVEGEPNWPHKRQGVRVCVTCSGR